MLKKEEIVQLIEYLSQAEQLELLEYLKDLADEYKWEKSWRDTNPKLVEYTQKAKQQIMDGLSTPMDFLTL